jgi:hypothetical protein
LNILASERRDKRTTQLPSKAPTRHSCSSQEPWHDEPNPAQQWRQQMGTRTNTDLLGAEQPLPFLLRSIRRRGLRHCFPRINRRNPAGVNRSLGGRDGRTPQRHKGRTERGGDGGRQDGTEVKKAEGTRKEDRGGYIYGSRASFQIYSSPRVFSTWKLFFPRLELSGEEMGRGEIHGEMPALNALRPTPPPHLLSPLSLLLPTFPFRESFDASRI